MHDNQRSDRRTRSGSGSRRNRGGRDYSNRGDRGERGDRGNDRNENRGERGSSSSRSQKPVKLSFWQKVLSIFGVKPKRAESSSPRPRSTPQPDTNGHRRFEAPVPRQTRKPEVVEVSSPKLYVGNLSFDASEGDLFELFNGVGKVQNAEVVSNKYTQKSKGFAFVTMLTADEARRAVSELHDKEFMGRKLVVSGAKTSDVASARPSAPSAPEVVENAPSAS